MERQSTRELAHRTGHGVDVTLLWVREDGRDRTVVRVRDSRAGADFELRAEPGLALDVYYHPYAYAGID